MDFREIIVLILIFFLSNSVSEVFGYGVGKNTDCWMMTDDDPNNKDGYLQWLNNTWTSVPCAPGQQWDAVACSCGHKNITTPESPQKATCAAWSQDHYMTFDGQFYSFKGTCRYMLASHQKVFEIMTVNDKDCTNHTFVSCKRTIEIYFFSGDTITLVLMSTSDGPVVHWNEERFSVPQFKQGINIEKVGNYITVRTKQFHLKWDGHQAVYITVGQELKHQLKGLCGNYNGIPDDDFETFEGKIVATPSLFGQSWKKQSLKDDESCLSSEQLDHKCLLFRSTKLNCNNLYSDIGFRSCASSVNVKPYLESCERDCCKTDDLACSCDAMTAYSRACGAHGIGLDWRQPSRCEIPCTGGRVYMECHNPCTEDCSIPASECPDTQCVDGCFCPEGHAFNNGTCVKREACPCTMGDEEYSTGEQVKQDCNTCTCNKGQWECTHEMCNKMCIASGQHHFKTFDGTKYDVSIKDTCTYVLMDTKNSSIAMTTDHCKDNVPHCEKSLLVVSKHFNSKLLTIKKNSVFMNGEVHELPFATEGLRVSMVSSLFMQVTLPKDGTILLWDGSSRIYIHASPSLINQTAGLCGYFDGKQKNDLKNPQHMVEPNAHIFFDSWIAAENCPKAGYVNMICDDQPQKLAEAKRLCSYLNDPAFKECHDIEAVERFYENCLSDMCACPGPANECLCPALGVYADTCSMKGVKMQNWRHHIKECEEACPGGQTYQVCGRPCERSCRVLALSNEDDTCYDICVEGCNCPDGQALDDAGDCVPLVDCPCVFDGKEYPVTSTKLVGDQVCVCHEANWNCYSSEDDNTGIPITVMCPVNMKYADCASSCPDTCDNHKSVLSVCSSDCFSGCVCDAGFLLDKEGGTCVNKSMCPCLHAGEKFYEGHSIMQDCNKCTCRDQNWHCEEEECSSTCSAVGDSHYTTFDDHTFQFQGICDYYLVRSQNSNPPFTITTRNEQCGSNPDTACSKGITITVGKIGTDEFKQVRLERGKKVQTIHTGGMTVREIGEMVIVTSDFGLKLMWDKGSRVYIELKPQHAKKVEGLCGNFDGDSENDFFNRNGLVVPKITKFADSWRVHDYCENSHEVADACGLQPGRIDWARDKCAVIGSSVFKPCHGLVDPQEYIRHCEFDSCACDTGGDCECMCTAIAAYAFECSRKEVNIQWRSPDLCGLTCDKCREYNPCMSTCPKKTCANRHNHAILLKRCEADVENTCVEGCDVKACPAGEVYDSLEEPVTCVPEPMCNTTHCEVNGQSYIEGTRVEDPDVCNNFCQLCYCRNGSIETITVGTCPTTTAQPTTNEETATPETIPTPPGTTYPRTTTTRTTYSVTTSTGISSSGTTYPGTTFKEITPPVTTKQKKTNS